MAWSKESQINIPTYRKENMPPLLRSPYFADVSDLFIDIPVTFNAFRDKIYTRNPIPKEV